MLLRYKTKEAAANPHLGCWNKKVELCAMGAPKDGSPVCVYNYPAFFPKDHTQEELDAYAAGMVIDFDALCGARRGAQKGYEPRCTAHKI